MMTKREITYTGVDGVERTETFYFKLSQAEVVEMEASVAEGFSEKLKKIAAAKMASDIIPQVRDFILKAYGEKSADGRRFVKSPELSKAFYETDAYDVLFMDFIQHPEKFAEFAKSVFPESEKTDVDTKS